MSQLLYVEQHQYMLLKKCVKIESLYINGLEKCLNIVLLKNIFTNDFK